MLKPTKFDKVVRREICSVQTKGTKRYSFIDGDSSDCTSSFLLAFCEKVRCWIKVMVSSCNIIVLLYFLISIVTRVKVRKHNHILKLLESLCVHAS